jgi:hypothetical protein
MQIPLVWNLLPSSDKDRKIRMEMAK